MIDLTGVTHHPAIEEIVDVLCNRTENNDRSFFRVEAAYFLGKMASTMRCSILTQERGEIPTNIYALLLATSGFGKGYSISIMEDEIMEGFRRRFMDHTFPSLSDRHLWDIANDRATRFGLDPAQEKEKVDKEFISLGAFPFTFDSATTPAVKQLRQKLLMGGIGAINLQIDEIGLNLVNSTEVLTAFLELYDQGKIKQKLTKVSADNQRGEDLDGRTPANMLLFGTPSKVFDGSASEDQFYSFLDTGYARRCFFGAGAVAKRATRLSPQETLNRLLNPQNSQTIAKWKQHFHDLADPMYYNWKVSMDEAVTLRLYEYKSACLDRAEDMPEHDEIRRAEMTHRHSRAVKLAGVLAFVDKTSSMEESHLMQAILLTEESGNAFQKILRREKNYVKIAKYLIDMGTELTHTDLHEAFPSFYSLASGRRNDLMLGAMAWAYKNNAVIKKSFVDGIEFFKGEALKETNLSEILVTYSTNYAYDYRPFRVPFDQLHRMTQVDGVQWANHAFQNGHRSKENVIPGCNMVVLDIDGTTRLDVVHELLKDIVHMTYTTKRHRGAQDVQADIDAGVPPEEVAPECHRFRLLIPINFELEMDDKEYKEFMANLMAWLPFRVDECSKEQSKTWASYNKDYRYNIGDHAEILDVTPFIPRTSRNEAFTKQNQSLGSLDNTERWFATRMVEGSRNNEMIKFALLLVDTGHSYEEVKSMVLAFNKKLGNLALPVDELENTVLVTVAKRYGAANVQP